MARWPGWVYDAGDEPDYRFSMANERTHLAWLRTSLALLAGGVAVRAIDLGLQPTLERAVGLLLVALGMLLAGAAWWRWASSERAIRLGEPLPSTVVPTVVAVGLLVVGALLLVAIA